MDCRYGKRHYLAPAIRLDGQKELGKTKFRTGCGIEQNEGVKFWYIQPKL